MDRAPNIVGLHGMIRSVPPGIEGVIFQDPMATCIDRERSSRIRDEQREKFGLY